MSRKGVVIKSLKLGALFGGSDTGSNRESRSAGSGREHLSPVAPVTPGVSSGSSRSAPGTVRDVPRCPSCRDESGNYVRKLRYWTSGNTWVWHCSAEPRGRDGSGSTFCGYFFTEDRPKAVCRDCGGSVRLLMVGGEQQGDFYYYCMKCKLKDY
jgi:hypothetical protein